MFSTEGDPISPERLFRRSGRVVGTYSEDGQTYLVVDLIDTKERVYFYYGGLADPNSISSLPAGTHFEAGAVTLAPSKPKRITKSRSAKKTPEPSRSSSGRGEGSDASTAGSIIIVLGVVFASLGVLTFRDISASADDGAASPEVGDSIEQPAVRSPDIRIRITTSPAPRAHKFYRKSGDEFWKSAGESSRIAGFDIGGMVYVGSGLGDAGGFAPEPALIDPKLSVSSDVDDFTSRRLPYWPSYTTASEEARAAYLKWLAAGRSAPEADIGYVFMYFYGLERRALVDAKQGAQAASELESIEMEVHRLLSIYENRSFYGYAGAFVDYLDCARKLSTKLYKNPPPEVPGRYLTFSHRLGLAQCAADENPLPAEWAYVWLMGDPSTRLRTPAQRCPEEFKRLFLHRYGKEYGDGFKLPRNKTQLRLDYRPASPGFRSGRDLGIQFELPDVSTLSSPVKKLQTLAQDCCSDLEPYSRSVGRRAAGAGTFDAIIELPAALWPDRYQKVLSQAGVLIESASGVATLPFSEFRSWFADWDEVTRDNYGAVCRSMASAGLGLEPDPLFGGALPAGDTPIAIFRAEQRADAPEANSRYAVAALTLHLSVAVAWADGHVPEAEQNFILKQFEEWLDFSPAERSRLQAHLRRMLIQPPKLTGLTKRIDALPKSARESLGTFLALVAQADNQVTPAEVKTLEKIFRLLGLETKTVYSNIHTVASEPVSLRPADGSASGFSIPKAPGKASKSFKIDPAKVAALKADSERVSTILSAIFVEETNAAPSTVQTGKVAEPEPSKDSILGLDDAHSAFLRVMLARAHWSRAELQEISKDHGLMLDGALEHLNDAAYDKFGKALLEGEDPVDLDLEVVKEIADAAHQAA